LSLGGKERGLGADSEWKYENIGQKYVTLKSETWAKAPKKLDWACPMFWAVACPLFWAKAPKKLDWASLITKPIEPIEGEPMDDPSQLILIQPVLGGSHLISTTIFTLLGFKGMPNSWEILKSAIAEVPWTIARLKPSFTSAMMLWIKNSTVLCLSLKFWKYLGLVYIMWTSF